MAYFAVFSQGTHMHVSIIDRCIDLFATVAHCCHKQTGLSVTLQRENDPEKNTQ